MDIEQFHIQVLSVLNAEKFGMDFEKFRKNFMKLTCEDLPTGYQTIDEIARKMSNVVKVQHDKKYNRPVLQSINCKEISHIQNLIQEQKVRKPHPMKVKTPQPLKRKPIAPPNQPQNTSKPVLARRLIGNTSTKDVFKQNKTNSKSQSPKSTSPPSGQINRSSSTSNFKSAKSDTPSFRNKLLELTISRKLPAPVYQSYTTTSRHKNVAIYLSKVTIGEEYWSSHPDSVFSPDEGEELSAKKAFLVLSSRPLQQTNRTLKQSSDKERRQLVDQLVQILKTEQFNLLSSAVPERFRKQFKNQDLPENWLKVVEEFPQDIQIEKLVFSNTTRISIGIPTSPSLKDQKKKDSKLSENEKEHSTTPDTVIPNGKASSGDLSNNFNQLALTESSDLAVQLLPENLILPCEEFWNVLLLEARSNNEVIMRLADTSEQYLAFLDKLSALYRSGDNYKVIKPSAGRIYAAVLNDNITLRVQALEMEDDQVQCVYVDEGGMDKLPSSSLKEIPNEMLYLPFQAFSVCLDNLEQHELNPRVGELLQEMIQEADNGLVLVAEPTSRQDPIKVLLYDTSGKDDIILNDLLRDSVEKLEQKANQSPPTALTPRTPNKPSFVVNTKLNSPNSSSVALSTLSASPSSFAVTSNISGKTDQVESNDVQLKQPPIENMPLNQTTFLPQLSGAQWIPPARLPEVNRRPKCSEEFYYITVTLPISPENFVVHEQSCQDSLGERILSNFEQMCADMQELYNDDEPIELHESLILPRMLVAAKDKDNRWKRARVQAIISPHPDIQVLVQLLDEGGVRVLGLQHLQPLYSQFAQIPIQAIRASLFDVKPIDLDWSPLAVYEFGKLIQEKSFRAVVHEMLSVDGEPLLKLTLYQMPDGSSISEQLVKMRLAKFA